MTTPTIPPKDYMYDVETYRNYFVCTVVHIASRQRWIFEIYDDVDQSHELAIMLHWLKVNKCRMVGFNNAHFDVQIINELLRLYTEYGKVTAFHLFMKAQQVIGEGSQLWPSDWCVDQLDPFKIHHFDNKAKTTSLKALEVNMRSTLVIDLPYPPDTDLTPEQRREVLAYNCHDVNQQIDFYIHSLPMIAFRDELTAKHGRNFANFNDTKIGKEIIIMRLEEALPGITGTRSQPRQTHRDWIDFGKLILPYIAFQRPEFQRILDYLKTTRIAGHETNAPRALDKLSTTVRGFTFDFGAGGIHGSVKKQIVRPDADHELIDVDVKSYYPNIAIVNKIFPEHLTERFCSIYEEVYKERGKHPKKSTESAMLKLALNGVYGDSNNVYSVYYDPAYTMAITINGQLLLCMLAEWLLWHDGITLVQINTDGMTARVHRDAKAWFEHCCTEWQRITRLELESVNYAAMFIRDVNNYIALDTKGDVKRKGAYQWFTGEPNNVGVSLAWHQDWSALVVPKAVQAAMIDGADLETFINQHTDPFDFMLRVKVPRNSQLVTSTGERLQNLTRYYVARSGPELFKMMPALKGKTEPRRFAIEKGWRVGIVNDARLFDWSNLNRSYYIQEAQKLVIK